MMPMATRRASMVVATVSVAATVAAAAAGAPPGVAGLAGFAVAAVVTMLAWPNDRRMIAKARAAAPPKRFKLDELSASLLSALPLGLVLVDRDGRIQFSNAVADELLERPVAGMMASAIMRAPALSEAIAAALSSGGRASVDVSIMRGRPRLVHATVGPIGHGVELDDAPRAAILLEDRTAMARAEQLRRDFVANASHELRTPLASIAGFIETLQTHGRDDPAAAERFLPIMAAQADRMRRLIDDLLSLNRIETDEHVQPRGVVDLLDAVRETAAGLVPVAKASGVAVVVDLPDTSLVVRGDQAQLAQVFANLIDNAIKYGRDEGTVRVAMGEGAPPRAGMVGISVSDDGPGIAREHLPRLTERFYRVSAETSRKRGGTGLGLAIAKHIVNRHRGELTITSTPGEGACFTVWLPGQAVAARDDAAA
jgi:two-component system phosphate regulon sensor histidine kinase PhoR